MFLAMTNPRGPQGKGYKLYFLPSANIYGFYGKAGHIDDGEGSFDVKRKF